MASQQDYRKPRNKELQDLVWNLPQPLRVRDGEGRLLWQNRFAELAPDDTVWLATPASWQNQKAVLETPAPQQAFDGSKRLEELEEELTRLKKQQRQTARKKRQAEESARKQEKSGESAEKKLRQQVERLEKDLAKLPLQAEKLKEDNKKLKEQLKSLRESENSSAKIEQLSKELQRAKEESDRRLDDIETRRKETVEQSEALFRARARVEELEQELAASANAPVSKDAAEEAELERVRALEQDKETLESWLEELERERDRFKNLSESAEKERDDLARRAGQLEGERDDSSRRVEELTLSLADLEQVFREFKEGVEKAESDREIEAQLAKTIAELEELEGNFEREQQAFEREKNELIQRLDSQERETKALKDGMLEKRASQDEEAMLELKEEIEDLRTELNLSQRREKRLAEKLATIEGLREEHGKVLELLKEDLADSRERERELKARLKARPLSSGAVVDSSETDKLREELKQSRQAETELREKITKLDSESHLGSSEDSLSISVKNQLEFLKKRLASTEKELDEARVHLKQEKAQNQSSKESERLAFQDTLTGLPNRNMIDRYLDYAHQRAKSGGKVIGLFLIDISGFRVLNKTHGFKWGDKLLKAVGERLNSMRGATHMVGRLGQDQFVLVAAELERDKQAQFLQEASRSLLEALAYPFEVDGDEVRLTGSVGVSFGPLEGDSSRGLYEHADEALGHAKKLGTSKYSLYDESLKQVLLREQTYSTQMAHALDKDEFRVVFQPVFNLNKGIVLGLELLLRWEHRDRRVLEPAEFLEPAIKSGLIFQITERVWPNAFKEFSKWRKMRPGLTLSINLSDRELLSPKVLKFALKLVKDYQLDPKSIIFEVRDQSHLRISPTWWRILQDYTSAGFGLCLDDFASDASLFGTLAYSGFVQAKTSITDDKALRLITAPNASKNLLYGVKHLQHRFDKKVLLKAGFHLAQGFAVSRPLDAADVDMVLS